MNSGDLGLYTTKSTSNVFNGTFGGVFTLLGGSAVGLGVMASTPFSAATEGHATSGALGAMSGFAFGATSGVLNGGLIMLGSTYSCVWQLTTGVLRTPSWLGAVAAGMDWDLSSENWVHYNLVEDAGEAFGIPREICLQAIGGELEIKELESRFQASVVKETRLYDVLGVSPGASAEELRRAYFRQARSCHPDKHLDDPEANAKFQTIGEAYLVLHDPKTRSLYDKFGTEGLSRAYQVPPAALFAMLFNSDELEQIVGELFLSPIANMFYTNFGVDGRSDNNKADNDAASATERSQRQRKREIRCGMHLLQRMLPFLSGGSMTRFVTAMEKEITQLAAIPLGRAMMLVIGKVFVDRSRSESSTLQSILNAVRGSGDALTQLIYYLHESAVLSSLSARGKQVAQAADASNRKESQAQLKHLFSHIVSLVWLVVKLDVAQTLDNVCCRLLHDTAIDSDQKLRRQRALLTLGELYIQAGALPGKGLDELVNRMCAQSGAFS